MNDSNYIHLHTHSCYSLLEACSSPSQLVEKAIELGHNALALTDTNSCSGLYEFNDICLKRGIKPILGLEINVCGNMESEEEDGPDKRIVLLVKNKIGWKNLCILSSGSNTKGFVSKPRIDYNFLRDHREGLILLSGGIEGHLANLIMYRRFDVADRLISFCKDAFKDDFYIEVFFHPSPSSPGAENIERQVREHSFELAKKHGVKCVCTNDVKYCNNTRKEVDSQDVLFCIKQHKIMKDDTRRRLPSNEYFMKSREELELLFPDSPELFDVTLEISDKIETKLIDKGLSLLPAYVPPNGMSPVEFLRSVVYDGLKKRNLFDHEEYKQRADYEIRVFEACGFINYFLVLYDFVNWARSNSIAMGPGRGSAAGSIALYCMDITKVDPIKYGLLFERFFSVDTKYVVDNSSFGVLVPAFNGILDTKSQHDLHRICSLHSEFNSQRFIAEGRKMKQMGCLDDFMKLFVSFIDNQCSSGDLNECNSVIAFYAGITSCRPKADFKPREDLVAARISPPDVDLDFDYHRRDEVFGYLRQKYGENRTAQIGTSSYFMGKMVIKDVGKVLDIGDDWEESQRIKAEIREKRLRGEKAQMEKPRVTLDWVDGYADYADTGLSFAKAYEASSELREHIPNDSAYYHICCQIDGLVRHHGIHAAGIVISKCDVQEVVPLRQAKGVVCTQFDKDQVEEIGLYKYDLLALMNVSVVAQTVKLIQEESGEVLDIDALEPVDQAVFDMLNDGLTEGVFQFESRAATELIKMIKINEFKDLVACNAINRPGPLKAGVGDTYARRKHGQEKIDYPHPSMQPVLEETYGLIVYQEQIMNLSRVMASFTRSQADKLRKAIGKKKQEIMDEMRQKFIDGCANNNISKAIAVEVWQMIEFFGEYGFNKSHSLAYAYLAYQTAYLKRYYPLEYFCALLSSCSGDKDKIRKYQMEAARLNVKLWPVNINKSKDQYFIERGGLRLPFTIVDGVGNAAVTAIIASQPYATFEDFVKNIDSRVNIAVIRNLAAKTDLTEGAFKVFGLGQEEAIRKFELLKNDLKKRKISSDRFISEDLFASIPSIKK